MRAYGFAIGGLISLGVGGAMPQALPQSVPNDAAPHVAAAKAAVGQGVVARIVTGPHDANRQDPLTCRCDTTLVGRGRSSD